MDRKDTGGKSGVVQGSGSKAGLQFLRCYFFLEREAKVCVRAADTLNGLVRRNRPTWEVSMGSISSIAAGAALAAAEVNALTVDVGFTATVAGKTYDAAVTFSSGQYVADDATLPGAEATGSNMVSAENNLINRIDALV
jgi:hypothetical protein